MYNNFNILEVTEENENLYIQGIVDLENNIYNNMVKCGKSGQLFTTSKEDIDAYIKSKKDYVYIAQKKKNPEDNGKVIAATYITTSQIPYTYNDITKYFKCSDEYNKFVKSKYSDEDYKKYLRTIYITKICAYKNARNSILQQYDMDYLNLNEEEKNRILMELIEKELSNPENQFHEKSYIRDNLNKYMSLYMRKNHLLDEYEQFYWADFEFLINQLGKSNVKDLLYTRTNYDTNMRYYDSILNLQKYKVLLKSQGCDVSKYFEANTNNTIELDTYITDNESRENGIARILVFEGLKKSMNDTLKRTKSSKIYLTSTLHKDNFSSKYVSEFFGLKDNMYVNRRVGKDREVHICAIQREKVPEYLTKIQKKLVALYDYNPQGIIINNDEKISILKEQIKYESNELKRLWSINEDSNKYNNYIACKISKINKLYNKIEKINAKENYQRGDY